MLVKEDVIFFSTGISSSDTRGSSIRYEPVQTGQTYGSSPHSSQQQVTNSHDDGTNSRLSRCLNETGSVQNDIDDDVAIREEEVPLTLHHRNSPPTGDHTSQPHRRSSAYVAHAHTDRLHDSKPSRLHWSKYESGGLEKYFVIFWNSIELRL